MKAEELLEKCEEKINKPWYNWINLRFLWYGFWDKTEKIREKVFKGIECFLDEDEVETFTKICDSRIDRAKSFLTHIVTGLSLLIASLAVIASILVRSEITPKKEFPLINLWLETGPLFQLMIVFLLILVLFLFLCLCHYAAQIHAWYAIKENTLLMYAKLKREGGKHT